MKQPKHDQAQVPGFQDVDNSEVAEELITGMRESAFLPAIVELRGKTAEYLESIPSGGQLLDVGCGLGEVLIDFGKKRGDVHLEGLDRSAKMLEIASADAHREGVPVTFEAGSSLSLPFSDDTFDGVRSERMLQWIDEPTKAVREIVRVTKPGGWVVLIDTDWRTAAFDLDDPRLEFLQMTAFGSEYMRSAGGRLRRWALDAGLTDVQEFSATSFVAEWNPDSAPTPLGLPPAEVLGQIVLAFSDATEADSASFVEALKEMGRQDRFHFSVSIFAVVGRK